MNLHIICIQIEQCLLLKKTSRTNALTDRESKNTTNKRHTDVQQYPQTSFASQDHQSITHV